MTFQTAFVVLFAVVLGLGAMAWFLVMDERRLQQEADAEAEAAIRKWRQLNRRASFRRPSAD